MFQPNPKLRFAITVILATLTITFCSLSTNMSLAQSEARPLYQALVLRDGASIHSGPGTVHYPTERGEQGDIVEVYRHDPGGWCAIRPTKDSFSIVPELAIEIVDDGVGRILADRTKAWVGTLLGGVDKPLCLVKLKKDELVQVLGQVSWPHPEGHSTVWYQISPPAGEFRWIKMDDIQIPSWVRKSMKDDLKKQTEIATKKESEVRSLLEEPPEPVSNFDVAVKQASLQTDQTDNQLTLAGPSTTNQGWRQATRPIQRRPRGNLANSSSSYYDRNSRRESRKDDYSGAPGSQSTYGKSPDRIYSRQDKPAEVPLNRVAGADVSSASLARGLNAARSNMNLRNGFQANLMSRRLSALELQLTQEMLKNPQQWNLETLELEAASIFRDSNDLAERNLADKFLTKIENCRLVRAGFQQTGSGANDIFRINPTSRLGSTGFGPSASIRPTNSIGPTSGSVNPNAVDYGTQFDAHGWLNPLIQNGGRTEPTYVLVDAKGKITHHVAPIQGMNLSRFVKSYVGINGQRGYHNRLKLDHVTAHQVTILQQRR